MVVGNGVVDELLLRRIRVPKVATREPASLTLFTPRRMGRLTSQRRSAPTATTTARMSGSG